MIKIILVFILTLMLISCTKPEVNVCEQFSIQSLNYNLNTPFKCPQFLANSETFTSVDLSFEISRYFEEFKGSGVLKVESSKELRQGMYQIFSFKNLQSKFEAFENYTPNKVELRYSDNFIYILVGGKLKDEIYNSKTIKGSWIKKSDSLYIQDLNAFSIPAGDKLGLSIAQNSSSLSLALVRSHQKDNLQKKWLIKNNQESSLFFEIKPEGTASGAYDQIWLEGDMPLINIPDLSISLAKDCDWNWNSVFDIEDLARSYRDSNSECTEKIKSSINNLRPSTLMNQNISHDTKIELKNLKDCHQDCSIVIDQDVTAISYDGQLQLGKLSNYKYAFKRVGQIQYIFFKEPIAKPSQIAFDKLKAVWVVKRNGVLEYFK